MTLNEIVAAITVGSAPLMRFRPASYALLCADLGITDAPRADHAQYLDHWLTVMKADKKAIFTAASKASEAVTFLSGLQGA
jgi:antirestriction protein ArdC